MDDLKSRLFAGLCQTLDTIEETYGAVPAPQRPPSLELEDADTSGNSAATIEDVQDESENSGNESGKIAALNDRFRQSYPTPNEDIKGEWLFDEDITKLGSRVEANIGRKIAQIGDDGGFEGSPLRDRGSFDHSNRRVIWLIKTYADESMQADAADPADAGQSFRLMLVSLADESQ